MKKILWLTLITIIFSTFINALPTPPGTQSNELTITGGSPADLAKIKQALPISVEMVEEALRVLEAGWENMSSEERAVYQRMYDPGNSGGIDGEFVEETLENFRRIQERLVSGLEVAFVESSSNCDGMTLYYTNFITIFVCPQFSGETNMDRLARDLVHEVVHMTFLAQDRAYFSETDSRYLKLTPRGSVPADLPFLSYFLRELVLDDTLYNPDAYTHFALEVARAEVAVVALHQAERTPDPELEAAAAAADEKLLTVLAPVVQD